MLVKLVPGHDFYLVSLCGVIQGNNKLRTEEKPLEFLKLTVILP